MMRLRQAARDLAGIGEPDAYAAEFTQKPVVIAATLAEARSFGGEGDARGENNRRTRPVREGGGAGRRFQNAMAAFHKAAEAVKPMPRQASPGQ